MHMHQPPLLLFDSTAAQLQRLVARMCYDDALVRRGYRLERLYLAQGFPHYRLYRGEQLIGVIDVRGSDQVAAVQRGLAAYLAGLGFTPANTRLVEFGARTSLDAKKRDLPRLWPNSPGKWSRQKKSCFSRVN